MGVLFDPFAGGLRLDPTQPSTGTGKVVRDISPTLVTPTLGVAAGTKLTLTPASDGQDTYRLNAADGTSRFYMGTYPSFPTFFGLWAGNLTPGSTNFLFLGDGSSVVYLNSPGNLNFRVGNTSKFTVQSAAAVTGVPIGWNSGGNPESAGDLFLAQDAANVLAQRNSTTAQKSRLYNTFTTLNTAGEWLESSWESNVLRFGTLKGSSSGTSRVLSIDFGATQGGAKTSALSFPINGGNITFGGPAALPAGTTSLASLNVPHGSAPTSPVDGDIWTTSAGLYVRINGATVGPLS